MAQMAEWTLRVVHGIMVVPTADAHGGECQQGHERERYTGEAYCVSDSHSDANGIARVQKRLDSNWMWDAGKALPVSRFVAGTVYASKLP
jgi:hypothetical protein